MNNELKEQVLLGDPFYHEIVNYLCTTDIFHMTQVHPYYYKIPYNIFKKSVILEINKKLKNIFGKCYPYFLMKFKKNYGYISGSFITQCILGKPLITNIDICLPMKNINFEYGNYKHWKLPTCDLNKYINYLYHGHSFHNIQMNFGKIKWIDKYKYEVDEDNEDNDFYMNELSIHLDKSCEFKILHLDTSKEYKSIKPEILNLYNINNYKNFYCSDDGKDGKDKLYIHRIYDLFMKTYVHLILN